MCGSGGRGSGLAKIMMILFFSVKSWKKEKKKNKKMKIEESKFMFVKAYICFSE